MRQPIFMTYLLPKFISKPIFWLATEVISEREIEDQQVINQLYFLSSDLLKKILLSRQNETYLRRMATKLGM